MNTVGLVTWVGSRWSVVVHGGVRRQAEASVAPEARPTTRRAGQVLPTAAGLGRGKPAKEAVWGPRAWLRRGIRSAAVGVVVASLFTGCSENQDASSSSSSSSTGRSGLPAPGVRTTDLTTTVGDPEEFPVPGSGGDTVTVGVLGLDTDGRTQVLSLVFTPHFESKEEGEPVSLSAMLGSPSFSPRLIDQDNLETYAPLDRGAMSPIDDKTVNGQPLYVFVVFAAPQNSVVDFELQINESWMPLHVRAETK